MTSRLDAWSVSDSRLSDAESARMEAEAAVHATNRRRAVRAIAAGCSDLDDARMMFEMLGIQDSELRAARPPRSAPTARQVTAAV